MAVVERSIILWRMPAYQVPSASGDIAALTISFADKPELIEHMGADRVVVSHALNRLDDGDYMLSLFLERP